MEINGHQPCTTSNKKENARVSYDLPSTSKKKTQMWDNALSFAKFYKSGNEVPFQNYEIDENPSTSSNKKRRKCLWFLQT